MHIFKSPKKAILFDLDGTLLDTAHDLTTAFNTVIYEYTQKTYSLSETRKLVGYGSKELFMHAMGECFDDKTYQEFFAKFRIAYNKLSHQKTALFNGLDAILKYLDTQKILWGIVTNKPYSGAVHTLNKFPELQTNHCLVGCDTAAYPKPAPEPLLYACDLLNITPDQACFVGDTPIDIEAGNHAGIETIAVEYGYGVDDIKTSKWQPTHWAKEPKDLLPFVKEIN